MSFVGIVANNRDFNNIQKTFLKNNASKSISLVQINGKNIENMRNITFETIIICKKVNYTNSQVSFLNKICENTSYLAINRDLDFHTPPSVNKNCTIITFGLNQSATITVSSISENGFVLSLQKNIKNIYGNIYEMEEKSIKSQNISTSNLYKILVDYIIKIIYKIQ